MRLLVIEPNSIDLHEIKDASHLVHIVEAFCVSAFDTIYSKQASLILAELLFRGHYPDYNGFELLVKRDEA